MKCEDLYKGRTIAIKIIKNVKKYREAAKLEINVLSKLAKYDPKVTVLDRKKMSNGRSWEIWVKHAGGELVRANVRLLRLPWPSVHRLRAAGFVKKFQVFSLTIIISGQSVFDFLKDNNYHPYPVEQVAVYAC